MISNILDVVIYAISIQLFKLQILFRFMVIFMKKKIEFRKG